MLVLSFAYLPGSLATDDGDSVPKNDITGRSLIMLGQRANQIAMELNELADSARKSEMKELQLGIDTSYYRYEMFVGCIRNLDPGITLLEKKSLLQPLP